MQLVEIPESGERSPAASFHATIDRGEQVVMGTIDGEVVAVAKLAREHDVVVLRGVQVLEKWRGRGLGARLLRAVAKRANPEDCWVIALGPLERFYAREGFVRAAAGVPAFLAERCAHYRAKGDDVFVALRSSTSDPMAQGGGEAGS